MPNYLGLLTKQECKEMRDLKASMPVAEYQKLVQIAQAVSECQKYSPDTTSNTFNQVVHTNTVKYFRNTLGYDVISAPAGTNMETLTSISWLV